MTTTPLEEQSQEETDDVNYENVNIGLTAEFKPALVVGGITILVFVLLGGGLPIYWTTGEGGYTLLFYTAPISVVIIVVLAFVYEYWVEMRENSTGSVET